MKSFFFLILLVVGAARTVLAQGSGSTTATVQPFGSVQLYPGTRTGPALVQAGDGKFYGTTYSSGVSGSDTGMVFSFDPATGGISTVHAFTTGNDGGYPYAPLVLGDDGNLYGTTTGFGVNGGGTVFRITPAGALTTLHSFGGTGDGSDPEAALLLADDGNFYGTTNEGGDNNNGGTVFRMTPDGEVTILYSFPAYGVPADLRRVYPGKLIQGLDGDFYGTTNSGGDAGAGSVFKITAAGVLTTLHSFGYQSTSAAGTPYGDGVGPQGLTQGGDGNFYGTTYGGGITYTEYGSGLIYKMTPDGTVTVLHYFSGSAGGADGFSPTAGLVWGRDGALYGATSGGEAFVDGFNPFYALHYSSNGTLFRVTPEGGFTTLYTFASSGDDAYPHTPLVPGRDGGFYGAASVGGIFRLNVVTPPSSFFNGETPLARGSACYLKFSTGNSFGFSTGTVFGYYSFLSDPHYLYHYDMGFEYVLDANDGQNGVYLYDFASNDFFYTSPTFPFPYLYDFNLQAFLYYYPDPSSPGRYNTNGVRYFYNFSTGKTITK